MEKVQRTELIGAISRFRNKGIRRKFNMAREVLVLMKCLCMNQQYWANVGT